jgi:DNA helicase-2/ATP-dependent DNA helicase PcrA
VFVLDENHRSTATIVSLANAIAAPLAHRPACWTTNPSGPGARLYRALDEDDEASFVGEEVRRLLQTGEISNAGQAAVLFRTNAQARALADALRSRGIPVHVRAEGDLFASGEVRDLIAYLRLAHNPTDRTALARVMDTPPRELQQIAKAFRKRPIPVEQLPVYAQKRGGPPARRAAEEFLVLLDGLHIVTDDQAPIRVLEAVLDRTAYAVWLAAQPDGPSRLRQIESFHVLLEHATAPDLATWLADLHLGELEHGASEDSVALLTVHAAKGREWPVVFVVGLEEGLLPLLHSRTNGDPEPDDSEERRLTYVALSRCQVLLYLTYCRARRRSASGKPDGRPEPRRVSRYLQSLVDAGLIHAA